MWHLTRPDDATVERFLARERGLAFSYPDAGCSREGRAPAGFVVDHHRERLGHGAATFERAAEALRAWQMFPAPWTAIVPARAPIAAGSVVGVLVHAGVWWTSSARIVYVIDEPRRFGFAYGTLPGHVERGEERFSVEWRGDDSVWYDLRAFSRPRLWAARLGRPLTRQLQHRFSRASKAAMRATVAK